MEKKKKAPTHHTPEPAVPGPKTPPDVPPEEIRKQLDTILANPAFSHAERLSRFLRFTVEEAIQGRGERIKEYVLALEVFDRADSFDPRADPVVRVEAHRLRAKLKEYYAGNSVDASVLIEYPKGSYVPVFQKCTPDQARVTSLLARISWEWKTISLVGVILVAVVAIWGMISLSGRYGLLQRQYEHQVAQGGTVRDVSSVAVLPFLNLSPEEDLEYLCDGISQEIISALTTVPGLRVVSRTSAFQFKTGNEDVRTIGERLNVGAVLEGSVRHWGEELRITAHLVDTRNGYHLWAETFDSRTDDVLVIQDRISASVVSALKLQLAGRRTAWRTPPSSLEAYNLYLKGRYFQNKRSEDGLRTSLDYFNQAVALDRNYALAYAGLADSHALLASGGFVPPLEAMPEARNAALKALQIDDRLGEVHASLGFIRSYYEWDWEGALTEYRRAIDLSPGYATAHHWYGGCLRALGLLDDAEKSIRRAQELDPLSAAITRDLGRVFRWKGQHDKAVAEFQKTLELDPGFSQGYLNLGLVYVSKNMLPEAKAAFGKAVEMEKDDPEALSLLAYCHASSGREAEAREILNELRKQAAERYVPPTNFAFIHIALGEKDMAFELLEEAYAVRDSLLSWLRVDPIFDSLRADRRFFTLLKKLNLESGDYE